MGRFEAVEASLTTREIRSIAAEYAFSESIAVIPDALKSGRLDGSRYWITLRYDRKAEAVAAGRTDRCRIAGKGASCLPSERGPL